jgi:hypothetical protein
LAIAYSWKKSPAGAWAWFRRPACPARPRLGRARTQPPHRGSAGPGTGYQRADGRVAWDERLELDVIKREVKARPCSRRQVSFGDRGVAAGALVSTGSATHGWLGHRATAYTASPMRSWTRSALR